jgi:hypothetical protein
MQVPGRCLRKFIINIVELSRLKSTFKVVTQRMKSEEIIKSKCKKLKRKMLSRRLKELRLIEERCSSSWSRPLSSVKYTCMSFSLETMTILVNEVKLKLSKQRMPPWRRRSRIKIKTQKPGDSLQVLIKEPLEPMKKSNQALGLILKEKRLPPRK